MATEYTNIYEKFTSAFTDPTLASLLPATLDSLFEKWISEASSIHFKESRTDLSDRDETLKQFNNTLSEEEQWVVAYGMILSWINSNVNDETKLKNLIGDRDYKTYSPANLLKALNELRNDIEWKLKQARERYDYDDWNFEGVL